MALGRLVIAREDPAVVVGDPGVGELGVALDGADPACLAGVDILASLVFGQLVKGREPEFGFADGGGVLLVGDAKQVGGAGPLAAAAVGDLEELQVVPEPLLEDHVGEFKADGHEGPPGLVQVFDAVGRDGRRGLLGVGNGALVQLACVLKSGVARGHVLGLACVLDPQPRQGQHVALGRRDAGSRLGGGAPLPQIGLHQGPQAAR
ncbi:MAG: hypothetical protein AMS14_00565, partial [Planctomycetes bacterium DG_20]